MSQEDQNQTIGSNTQVDTKRDELDLSRKEDLMVFLENAEDIYADAAQYQATAKAENYQSLNFDDVKGVEIFDALFGLLKELQKYILSCEDELNEKNTVTDEAVEKMQELYDSMVLLRNLVLETYKGKSKVSSDSSQKEQRVSGEKQGKAADQRQGISIATKQTTQDSGAEKIANFFTTAERVLGTAEQQLDVIKARVLNCVPLAARTPEVMTKLNELSMCSQRLKSIKDRVRSSRTKVTDSSVLTQALGNYSQLVAKIIKEANSIEQILLQQQSEVTLVAKSMVSGTTSSVRPLGSRTCLNGVTQKEESQEVPSEAVVAFLVKPIFEDQFYSEAERVKVQELCENFHRSVATAEAVPIVNKKYKELSDFVSKIGTNPEVTELRERANRIVRRVMTGLSFDSELLRKIHILEQEFRKTELDPGSSYENKLAAYRDLVGFVRESEKEWLTVCGMHVPLSGPRGVAMARSLRETLLIERDRHSELVRDPKKQLLADKLIRKLSSIPPTGLSAEIDIPEIIRLMRAIDVSGQQGQLVNPGGKSICLDCLDDEDEVQVVRGFGSQDPQHKVMDISIEDVELPIEIRVADKTKELIAKRTEQFAARSIPKLRPIQPVGPIQGANVEGLVVAQTEQRDPINLAVPIRAPRITPVAPIHEKRSLTKLYLSDPVYQTFITKHYTSVAAFERMLDTVITQIEAKTVDAFERWLHEEHSSPFMFLEEKTVNEVLQLAANREVRQMLVQENIKYETFLVWIDLVDEMQAVVGGDPEMKFGELYARWMIESEMSYETEYASA